ncbi:MAG: hypothetical protein JETT_3362 [Candidatus Jettenia ecosi]|uniref:Uncharacterized protein n=1 Tax=Candidatus Jettenia ecosi TaxID=2494326 RepID=A0A533Q6X0_9BACT|nr:MAG: hypothetical protein JETT_3362 [Candidatus Jettenia ecosi]
MTGRTTICTNSKISALFYKPGRAQDILILYKSNGMNE